MRNKSNLKPDDDRSISQKIHDSELNCEKIFVNESVGIEKTIWENRVKELEKEICINW